MKKVILFLAVIIVLGVAVWLFLILSKPSIKPEAPLRSTLDSTLEVPVSTIRIPIEFKTKDLERMVNNKLKGSFIKDWIATGNKKDSIYLESSAPIRLAWIGNPAHWVLSFRFA